MTLTTSTQVPGIGASRLSTAGSTRSTGCCWVDCHVRTAWRLCREVESQIFELLAHAATSTS